MGCECETINGGIAIGCENNVAGLRSVALTEKCNVTSFALSSPGDEISAFTMAALTSFYAFAFTKQSGSNYTESTKLGDNGGNLSTQTLTLNFNRREKTKRDTLMLTIKGGKDLVAIATDNNGINWYLGEVSGINVKSIDGGSGENKPAKNGYTVVIEGEEENPANTVTDAALAAVL